jgi:hypothetical protein
MAMYRRLNLSEQTSIASFVHTLAKMAKGNRDPIVRKLARATIIATLWRWTADAINVKSNCLVQDKYKYDPSVHHITEKAAKQLQNSKGSSKDLRHEHAVPRKYLAKRIIEKELAKDEIVKLLRKYCCAVITTKKEATMLIPKDSMPEEWDWENGHRHARYRIPINKIPLIAPKHKS